MGTVLHQIANTITVFTYEVSIAVHPFLACVTTHSMPNCQHHALFQVQLCVLAFSAKLLCFLFVFFFLTGCFKRAWSSRCDSGLNFCLYIQPWPAVWSEKTTSVLCVSTSSQHGCVFELQTLRDHSCDIKSKYCLEWQAILELCLEC